MSGTYRPGLCSRALTSRGIRENLLSERGWGWGGLKLGVGRVGE